MLRNYLTIAFRNLLKHKGYSAINVFGLAIGIACFMLILLYVQDEISYDRYHEDADRIYRIAEIIEGAEESASVPLPVGETLVTGYPDYVLAKTRFFNFQVPSTPVSYESESGEKIRFTESGFYYTDSTLFDVFDFELLEGDARTALARPNTMLVTASTARKYFGDDDSIGKTLRLEGQNPTEFEVVGVLADVPDNSHFTFDLLASFQTINTQAPDGNFGSQNFYWNPAWTYVKLRENVRPEQVDAVFPDIVEQYFPDQIKEVSSMYLQPLTDIHLHSRLDFEIRPNSDMAYVYIFSAIAIFVLLIACINFMNLSTARSAQRAREVGVRKSIGAFRFQLIRQFLGESMLSALLSGLVAIPLIYGALPALNSFAEKNLWLDLFGQPWILGVLIGVPLIVGALSGMYPALFLSAFDAAAVLKGTFVSRRANVAVWLRRGLVSMQFVISIVLIAGTIVAYKQLDYMRNKKLGFDKAQVVLVPMQLTQFSQSYQAFKSEAEQYPNILETTVVEDVPGSKYQTNNYVLEGSTDQLQFPRLMVHDGFVETFGMELAAGRAFSADFPADSNSSIMVNEALVRRMGWDGPDDAIGRQVTGGGPNLTRTIIGVVKDFHYASLHQEIGPFVIERYFAAGVFNFFGRYLAVRIAPNDVEGTLAWLEDQWDNYVTNRSFEYFFLDAELDALYRAEATLGKVATTFSILAILVACLGLFGMASFTAERRTKEIGVRKVMGASVGRIVMLLSGESVKLVGLAFLVAAPLAYLAVDSWLETFSYRTEAELWPFIIAGTLVLIISWVTVGVQSLKAAGLDPVVSLRYE